MIFILVVTSELKGLCHEMKFSFGTIVYARQILNLNMYTFTLNDDWPQMGVSACPRLPKTCQLGGQNTNKK